MKTTVIPEEIKTRPCVVLGIEKGAKAPVIVNPNTGVKVDPKNPGYHLSFDEASSLVNEGKKLLIDGKPVLIKAMAVDVGPDIFVVTIKAVDGKITPEDQELLEELGSYFEGTNGGIRMFCSGRVDSLKKGNISIRTGARTFIPMTGNSPEPARPLLNCEEGINVHFAEEYELLAKRKMREVEAEQKRLAEESVEADAFAAEEALQRQREEEIRAIQEEELQSKQQKSNENEAQETDAIEEATPEPESAPANKTNSLMPESEPEPSKKVDPIQTTLIPEADGKQASLLEKEEAPASKKTWAKKSASKSATAQAKYEEKAAAQKAENEAKKKAEAAKIAEAEAKMKAEMAKLAETARLERFNYLERGKKENLLSAQRTKIAIGPFHRSEDLNFLPGLTGIISEDSDFEMAVSWVNSVTASAYIDYEGRVEQYSALLSQSRGSNSDVDIRYYAPDPNESLIGMFDELPCQVIYIHAAFEIGQFSNKDLIELRSYAKRCTKHIFIDMPDEDVKIAHFDHLYRLSRLSDFEDLKKNF